MNSIVNIVPGFDDPRRSNHQVRPRSFSVRDRTSESPLPDMTRSQPFPRIRVSGHAGIQFTAVVYVLTTGWAWRHLSPSFGIPPATAHRRFAAWTRDGLWRRLHQAVLDEFGAQGELDWSAAIVDASVRAKRGGDLTGPNPVDR